MRTTTNFARVCKCSTCKSTENSSVYQQEFQIPTNRWQYEFPNIRLNIYQSNIHLHCFLLTGSKFPPPPTVIPRDGAPWCSSSPRWRSMCLEKSVCGPWNHLVRDTEAWPAVRRWALEEAWRYASKICACVLMDSADITMLLFVGTCMLNGTAPLVDGSVLSPPLHVYRSMHGRSDAHSGQMCSPLLSRGDSR